MKREKELIKFLNNNNGYITTAELVSLNISKPRIQYFINKGIIEKVSHGLYMDTNKIKDEYYILQQKYPSAIFSYNTAFHIFGFTNKVPSVIDISIPKDKRVRGNYNVHYVSDKYYDIGIVEVLTPFNNPVRVYNLERCLCDMLKNDDSFDLELRNRILSYYFNNNKSKNIELLIKYAKIFNIYEKVNLIMGVMMKW